MSIAQAQTRMAIVLPWTCIRIVCSGLIEDCLSREKNKMKSVVQSWRKACSDAGYRRDVPISDRLSTGAVLERRDQRDLKHSV